MKVTAIKTHKITEKDTDILKVLDKYLPPLEENTVVAVTSKIVSICEGSIVKIDQIDKDELIQKEAAYYMPREINKYNISMTIKNNLVGVSAGVDESNGNGYYVLWPKDPQESANIIRKHLLNTFSLKHVGVVITDSRSTPLRWGVTGVSLAHSGIAALKDYKGTKDLFGREFKFERLNIADSLATAAAVVMGEGDEQSPLAVITDTPFVSFQKRNPTEKELQELVITLEEDMYVGILKDAKWKKGQGK